MNTPQTIQKCPANTRNALKKYFRISQLCARATVFRITHRINFIVAIRDEFSRMPVHSSCRIIHYLIVLI